MRISEIKRKRLVLGYSVEEVANKVGASISTIYTMEQGRYFNPRASFIKKLSILYGCTTDEIFRDLNI